MVEIKFTAKIIGQLSENGGVFIVGQCPGKQRKSADTRVVWEGNRSGDFISKILAQETNIYLTNVFNYWIDRPIDDEIIKRGISEFADVINLYKPRRIICLGNFSFKLISKAMEESGIEIVELPHPSWWLRFNKDKDEYTQKLLNEVRK